VVRASSVRVTLSGGAARTVANVKCLFSNEVTTMEIQSAADLTGKRCQACEGGVAKFTRNEAARQIKELGDQWELSADDKMISRKWKLKNFVQAMELAGTIARLAEEEQHHPDLHITGYRNLRVDLTTHAIDGLSENDFILAAKIDAATA
jgi:4a-hydroxytetrahydrobiopterin dehydratase